MGKLEELPSFLVKGIEHRFIGYQLGNFDRIKFVENLKKFVEASVAVIGDIPYKQTRRSLPLVQGAEALNISTTLHLVLVVMTFTNQRP